MRAVIQRTEKSSVSVNGGKARSIGRGLTVLLGAGQGDGREDIEYLVRKIVNMRIFSDNDGKMNLSVKDIGGDLLIISQFTLFASTKKGNRPSLNGSAPPDEAVVLYEHFVQQCGEALGTPPVTGEFGADMKVELINDGPVTIILDSRNRE